MDQRFSPMFAVHLAFELRERSRYPSGQPRISPQKAREIVKAAVRALRATEHPMTEPDRLEALKPCPFCRANNVALQSNIGKPCSADHAWVQCFTCHTDGPEMLTEAEAIAAWNARPIETNSRTGDLERVKDALSAWAQDTPSARGKFAVIRRGAKVAEFDELDDAYDHARELNALAAIAALSAPQSITPPEVGGELAAAQRLAEFADTHLRSPGSAKLWEDRTEHNRQYFLAAARVALSTPEVVDGTAGLVEALKPFEREIDRLERDYGFDRPVDQYQCLMVALGDLLALRTALSQHRGVSRKGGNDGN